MCVFRRVSLTNVGFTLKSEISPVDLVVSDTPRFRPTDEEPDQVQHPFSHLSVCLSFFPRPDVCVCIYIHKTSYILYILYMCTYVCVCVCMIVKVYKMDNSHAIV